MTTKTKTKTKRGVTLKLPMTGGCHCGALRYRIRAKPKDSGYCHCTDCQGTTGAPTTAWFVVPLRGFAYVKGVPKVYKSSAWGQREFCGNCGCQILFRLQRRVKTVSINTPTLVHPAAVAP